MKPSILLIGCSVFSGALLCNLELCLGKKPNIIFILTDDQRWDALGYVGNKMGYPIVTRDFD